MRALILSHGHPSFSIGGAEVASYNLHRGLNHLEGHESHYLARVGPPVASHRDTPFMSLRQAEREMLFYANDYDYFRFSNRDIQSIEKDLTRYVREVDPDVVHFHHLLGFLVLPSVQLSVWLGHSWHHQPLHGLAPSFEFHRSHLADTRRKSLPEHLSVQVNAIPNEHQ